MKRLISFCIPCYRSAKTIGPVIDEITLEMGKRAEEFDFEIVCVVDGSPDNVFAVLKDIARDNHRVKAINLAKNFGQAGARMATLRYARGEFLVCLDDDGQCPMNRFWDLFAPMEEGCDVSIAQYSHKKQSAFKNFGSYVNRQTTRLLLDVPADFTMTNFFILRRYVAQQMLEYTNPYPFMTGLIARTTNNYRQVPMEDRDRLSGTTGYTLKKLLSHWLNGFTAFSVIPLRISSVVGVICAFIGFVYGLFTIIRKLILGSGIMAGYSSTIAIVLFIGGLIMMMLGMIGEYVGRIYISLNNSPQYVVRETVNVEKEET